MAILPMQDFVTSCTGHLKNIGSLSYAAIPKVDTFHFTISKKSHSVISSLILLEKFFKCGEAVKLMVVDACYTKF